MVPICILVTDSKSITLLPVTKANAKATPVNVVPTLLTNVPSATDPHVKVVGPVDSCTLFTIASKRSVDRKGSDPPDL